MVILEVNFIYEFSVVGREVWGGYGGWSSPWNFKFLPVKYLADVSMKANARVNIYLAVCGL